MSKGQVGLGQEESEGAGHLSFKGRDGEKKVLLASPTSSLP